MSYVLSVFPGPTTAEGEEFGLSTLAAYDLSPEVAAWIATHTDGDPDAWVLVTDEDGDFSDNTSPTRLEVRVQDGTVVTASA